MNNVKHREKRQIEIRPYTLRELASIYGVCSRTLKKWMEPFLTEIGEKKGRYFTITQVKIVFKMLSTPSWVEIE
jgi:hypothetical protein